MSRGGIHLRPDRRYDRGRLAVRTAAVVAYGTLFSLVLPALLIAWMRRLDTLVHLRPVASVPLGAVLALAGSTVIAVAVVILWRQGRGLPMSFLPPARFVSRGIYAVVADPIYAGAVLACMGVAIALGSAAGLWIVTPVFALAEVAFVLGYERDATRRRYGRVAAPLLALPPDDPGRPSAWNRVAVYALVIIPWVVLYEAVVYLGVPPDARSTYLFDAAWPVVPWTEAIYVLAYPLVLLAPLAARRRSDLRRFAASGLVATAVILPFYLLVPLVAPAKPVPDGTMWAPLLRLERSGDASMTAFPAFHLIWACIAVDVYARRWPRARWASALVALAIGVSCVTAGMHSVADVAAALVAVGLLRARRASWAWLCRATERIANSWRETTIGPVRFLSHGIYAGLGAALGAAAGVTMAGPRALGWMIAMSVAAAVGAAMWAQVVEGSTGLLRPYGYFGSVLAVVAIAPVAWLSGVDPWLLLAGMSVAACITQPLGRLRCLIQGCCHGRRVEAEWGIRYSHPRSRVVRMSVLGGVRVHPTQLYSILSTLVVAAVLIRLWKLAVPLPFIVGAYLVLIGLSRFVEEHYRGEPQTARIAGLRLYQWLAIALVVAGAAVTAVGGASAPPPQTLATSVWPVLAVLGLVTYFAYGVDFPRSNRRFSRLV